METRPVIYDSDARPPEIYSGVPSFLGLPVAKTAAEAGRYDFAVLGVPWEGGCTIGGFSSVVLAPKAIREVSLRYVGYLPDYDLDTFDYLTLCDAGDTATRNGDYEFTFAQLRSRYGELLDQGTVPIVFGGDHSISYPTISELAKRHPKRVGVIHLDAHLDNMTHFGNDLLARCSPFSRLYRDENIDPTRIVHIGTRGPRNHPIEGAEARKHGANVITMTEIRRIGWQAAIEKALELAGRDTDVLYLTICSDVLDCSANPQGPVDPCGLTSFELAMMVNECGYRGVRSFDFVEVFPENGSKITVHTAAWAALYFMNGHARRMAVEKGVWREPWQTAGSDRLAHPVS